MLGLMRKHAGSLAVKIILGAIVVAFALSFGVSSYFSQTEIAFKINGESVTSRQLADRVQDLTEMRQAQGGTPLTQEEAGRQARQEIIDSVLLRQTARQMGIGAGEEEVRAEIMRIPAFLENGVFDFNRYRSVLQNNRTAPEIFEAGLAEEIALNKLRDLIISASQVTPGEAEQFMDWWLSKTEGVYLLFQAEQYLDRVELSQADKEIHYREYMSSYTQPAQMNFSYLRFTPQHFASAAAVSDDEILARYELDLSRFVRPEGDRVSYITFLIPPNAGPENRNQIMAQAQEAQKLAQTQGSDFTALAGRYGQDPAGRDGQEGWFYRGQLAEELERQLFAAPVGETIILEAPNKLMVVKIWEHKDQHIAPLEEVEGQIKESLLQSRMQQEAEKAADLALQELHRGKTLASVAQAYGLTVEGPVTVTPDDDLPGLPPAADIWEVLQGLSPDQPGLPLPYDGDMILPVLNQYDPPAQLSLEQVEQQVTEEARNLKAGQLAREAALSAIAGLKEQAEPAQSLLAMPGARRTGLAAGNEEIPDLAGSDELHAALLKATAQKPLIETPLPVLDGLAVAALLQRTDPTAEDKDNQREMIRERLQLEKNMTAVALFMADLHAQAEIEGLAP
ncbi:MAG: SurA N-terminal domain-containing protein [Desulfarculales bacterium]|jgi:peptidyl-prolyl cis-trans isomerase D|nr:SurA N-terminal domain-containing protein [Desulfarculales bacterium]